MSLTIQIFSGPKIDRETYERSQRHGKAAKKLSVDAKAVRTRIRLVRETRAALRQPDPLVAASGNRKWRLRFLRETKIEHEQEACRQAIRETLLRAARTARSMGFAVRASKSRAGRISSYYATPAATGHAPRIRISDHEIPCTDFRDAKASIMGHGFYSGYNGPEIIIDRARTATWLRRAIILTAAGRDVPGITA